MSNSEQNYRSRLDQINVHCWFHVNFSKWYTKQVEQEDNGTKNCKSVVGQVGTLFYRWWWYWEVPSMQMRIMTFIPLLSTLLDVR